MSGAKDDLAGGVLTAKKRAVLAFIIDEAAAGRVPTVREIGRALAIASPSHVSAILGDLEAMGFIKRFRRRHRGIAVRRFDTDRATFGPGRHVLTVPPGMRCTVQMERGEG